MSSLAYELRKRVERLKISGVSGGGILFECADELDACEDAMKRARWAIALQLRRWRDGDAVNAVAELQTAHDSLAGIVGDDKPREKVNAAPETAKQRDEAVELLIEVLPYVTDAIDDPTFKTSAKPAIRGLEQRIRAAIALAEKGGVA